MKIKISASGGKEKGSVLVVSLLILFAVVIIALSSMLISVKERKNSIESGKSSQAFQTANTGIEEIMSDIMRKCLDPTKCARYTANEMFNVAGPNDICTESSGLIEKGDYKVALFRTKDDGSLESIACNDITKSIYYISNLKSIGKDSAGREQRAIGATVLDRHTKLLIHADGVNNSTIFTDSSPSTHIITPEGDAKISTAANKFKFGGASAYFDGSGDYLSVDDIPEKDWNFNDKNFIIDAWVYFSNANTLQTIASQWDDGAGAVDNQFKFYYDGANKKLGFAYSKAGNNSGIVDADCNLNDSQWYHLIIKRTQDGAGNHHIEFFVGNSRIKNENIGNGVSFHDSDLPLIVGANMNGETAVSEFNGYIDEFHIWRED